MKRNEKIPPKAISLFDSIKSIPIEEKSENCRLNTDINAAARLRFFAAKCKGLLSFNPLFIPKIDIVSEYNVKMRIQISRLPE